MLLRKCNDGRTAWHLAARWGKQDLMPKLGDWAKEKLATEEI
jgi:hypothetical protein